MITISRSTIIEGLSGLSRYGFGQSQHSAICLFGEKVAAKLTGEEISAQDFVLAYVSTIERFVQENSTICIRDYRDVNTATRNITAQMWNIAERVVSEEFSEEARVAFEHFLDYLLKSKPCPSNAIN